jgi:hypothetical protein
VLSSILTSVARASSLLASSVPQHSLTWRQAPSAALRAQVHAESLHPAPPGTLHLKLHIAGAEQLVLRFDPRCDTSGMPGGLALCSSLLFDEIDAGVSGRVSAAMASLLRRLAATRQVFCVTHQPVVAAAADQHLQVSKAVEGGQTLLRVSQLRDPQERQRELAELAGGDSGEAREFAASLLQTASASRPQ